MYWIAPSEKDTAVARWEQSLYDAADRFRANWRLKSHDCSAPVLDLILLRFAEVRVAVQRVKLESPSPLGADLSCLGSNERNLPEAKAPCGPSERARASHWAGVRGDLPTSRASRRGLWLDESAADHSEGIADLPTEALFDYRLDHPEAENIGAKLTAAIRGIGKPNPHAACLT